MDSHCRKLATTCAQIGEYLTQTREMFAHGVAEEKTKTLKWLLKWMIVHKLDHFELNMAFINSSEYFVHIRLYFIYFKP